jgi:hypothetical protein
VGVSNITTMRRLPQRGQRAARFGKGTSTPEGAQQAQDARRDVKPGSYDRYDKRDNSDIGT